MNKTGHFNFAENRTFLLCLDRKMSGAAKAAVTSLYPPSALLPPP
ncbi:MAG: hypothetical protein ACOX2F_12770 [bacterium]